jgi:hypothetical protein
MCYRRNFEFVYLNITDRLLLLFMFLYNLKDMVISKITYTVIDDIHIIKSEKQGFVVIVVL